MRIGLWQRLFLAFAALSVAALAAFVLLQQQGFRRGLLDYVNRLDLERVEEAADNLGKQYAWHGNWDFMRNEPQLLMRALGIDDAPPPPPRRFDQRDPPDRREGPPPDRRDGPPPDPPADDARRDDRDRRDRPDPPRGPRPGPPPPRAPGPPPRPEGPMNLASRLTLFDAEGNPVLGNPRLPADAPTVDIRSGAVVVGRLRLAPLPRLRGGVDLAFAMAQTRSALLIALGVLAGALVFAWALARWLLAPIRALAGGTRALTAGEYATRIDVQRGDELGALAADFNQLAQVLERNREARRQWGADIAHELRTPLSVLRGEIQALQDGVRQVGPDTFASLHAECDRLTGLVEDLYQLALSDAGALGYQFEAADLDEVLRDAVAAAAGSMSDARLEIESATLPRMPVRADTRRLAQLFANILGNARRYTDAGGRVRVSAAGEGASWRIDIDDTPPGVPADALPLLFERLFRVENSRSRSSGGAGLGLAICKNIVDAHGGTIEAAASPLGGLRITLRLPAAGEGR